MLMEFNNLYYYNLILLI